MAPPTPLAIATSAVNRLVKEKAYYRKELASQAERVEKLEQGLKENKDSEDGNAEYMLKQEQKAMEETKAVFAPLDEKIQDSVLRLEEQIATAEGSSDDSSAAATEMTKAQEALKLGQEQGGA